MGTNSNQPKFLFFGGEINRHPRKEYLSPHWIDVIPLSAQSIARRKEEKMVVNKLSHITQRQLIRPTYIRYSFFIFKIYE